MSFDDLIRANAPQQNKSFSDLILENAPAKRHPAPSTDELRMQMMNETPQEKANRQGADLAKTPVTNDPNQEHIDLGKTAANILPSAGNYVKNIYTAIRHPIDTAESIGNVALGGVKTLVRATGMEPTPGNETAEPSFDTFMGGLKERYGGLSNIKQTIQNDPVGFLADLSGLLSGAGAVTKTGALSKAGEAVEPLNIAAKLPVAAAGSLAKEFLGKTTGAGAGAIEEAYKGSPMFKAAMRGNVSPDDVLLDAKGALHSMKIDRANTYVEQLNNISNIGRQIDITPLRERLNTVLDSYNVQRKITPIKTEVPSGLVDASGNPITTVKTTLKKELDFTRSTLDRNAVNDTENIINKIDQWGTNPIDRTPKGLDILKRQLDDFYSESKNSRALVSNLRNVVNDLLVREVPEYEQMTAQYAKTTQLTQEIEKALSLGTRTAADTSLRKLMSVMRENFEFRRGLVKQLESSAGKDISGEIAGVQLNKPLPRGLLGPIFGMGTLYEGLTRDPTFLALLATSSPRLVGEFTLLLGQTKRVIEKSNITNPTIRQGAFQSGRIGQQKGGQP